MNQKTSNENQVDMRASSAIKSILAYIRSSATQTKEVSDQEIRSFIEARLEEALAELGVDR